jgi:NAD-dependent DNA ligase
MNKLHKFLDQASQAYYAGTPVISDQVFDQLADSCAYNKIGAVTHGKKAKHLYPMYSLQKFYEDEGKADPLAGLDITTSIKLDGAAISLLYVNGVLAQALTRGDGVEGQVITDKMYEHGGLVPLNIELTGTIQITGEIVAPLHVENSRNYAAGSLNLKDLNEFKTRAIEFFAYQATPSLRKHWSDDMTVLKYHGFNTVLEPELGKIYPSDGIVVRVENNHQFEQLGYTSKHPRGAYARKERAAHVETKLLGVEWNVGKTGKVTPTAILEPVKIGDALVSRATLNNPGFIEALDLQIGDTVAVARAGEIIPCILHKVDA